MFTRGAWIHWALHIYHYIYLLWLFLSKPTTSILTRKNVQVHRLCFEACQGQRSWHKFKASPVPMPGANRKVPTGAYWAFQEGVEGCVLVKANKLKVFVNVDGNNFRLVKLMIIDGCWVLFLLPFHRHSIQGPIHPEHEIISALELGNVLKDGKLSWLVNFKKLWCFKVKFIQLLSSFEKVLMEYFQPCQPSL